MYISLIIPSLYSQGAEYVVAALSRGFVSLGHRVEIVVTADQSEMERMKGCSASFKVGTGVRIVRLPFHRARWNFCPLIAYLTKNSPDLVLCNAEPFRLVLALANMMCFKKVKAKIVHVEHLGGIGYDSQGREIDVKAGFLKRVDSWIYNHYDAVFAVSQGTGTAINRVRKYPIEKIHFVYNPVIDDIFYEKIKLPPAHPWLQEKSSKVIVAAGAFCNVKNYPLLIRAFSKVLKKKECRLIIFGEGRLRDEYEALISNLGLNSYVSLPGYTNNLPAELNAADCFVVSSYVESFSIVLVEALACGVPCVATDAPSGPREILANGLYGRLVPNCDEDALAAAIYETLQHGCENVPNEAWSRYSLTNIAKQYEKELMRI